MFRCELCDGYLPIFQTGRLCEICYKIRTIIKCYSATAIHKYISDGFLINLTEEETGEIEEEEPIKPLKEIIDETVEKAVEEEKELHLKEATPQLGKLLSEMKTRHQTRNNKK
tara:strand:- start:1764 stop:2102 length:339 start_codon:yes stop_codon:yes gene_type:complete